MSFLGEGGEIQYAKPSCGFDDLSVGLSVSQSVVVEASRLDDVQLSFGNASRFQEGVYRPLGIPLKSPFVKLERLRQIPSGKSAVSQTNRGFGGIFGVFALENSSPDGLESFTRLNGMSERGIMIKNLFDVGASRVSSNEAFKEIQFLQVPRCNDGLTLVPEFLLLDVEPPLNPDHHNKEKKNKKKHLFRTTTPRHSRRTLRTSFHFPHRPKVEPFCPVRWKRR